MSEIMLHWQQVWSHMRQLTNRHIEKRAIMEFISYFEPQMSAVIKQSALELEKLNDSKGKHGLHQKNRIDGECIKRAIKTMNGKQHTSLPIEAGGKEKKVIYNEAANEPMVA